MLAVVQEDPETSQSSEHEQVEDDSVAGPGVTNQPEDNCYSSSTSIATNIPVKRIEALKVSCLCTHLKGLPKWGLVVMTTDACLLIKLILIKRISGKLINLGEDFSSKFITL